MSDTPRERIFANLRAAVRQDSAPLPMPEPMAVENLSRGEKIERLKTLMEAVNTQVHVIESGTWVDKLKALAQERQLKTLLYPAGTPLGDVLETAWDGEPESLPQLLRYQDDVEDFKETLFEVDASVTSTVGGIAQSGSLIVWPTPQEPRLMSLVPPVHIAILDADKIYHTFNEALTQQQWANQMPTNALLISGPSKTADIELTLTFGVHGPKELIVLVLAN